MLRTAVALRHVAFEDLGAFQTVLEAAGYKVHYYDVGVDALWTLEPVKTELVIVLGGPIGVYETDRYPFLAEELDFLRARLAANRPTLGICLGAQLMATALGAPVAPSGTKEIGFAPLTLTSAGLAGPLRHLADVTAGFERWLIGHACELAAAGIDPGRLRDEAAQFGSELRDAGRKMLAEWLRGLRA